MMSRRDWLRSAALLVAATQLPRNVVTPVSQSADEPRVGDIVTESNGRVWVFGGDGRRCWIPVYA